MIRYISILFIEHIIGYQSYLTYLSTKR